MDSRWRSAKTSRFRGARRSSRRVEPAQEIARLHVRQLAAEVDERLGPMERQPGARFPAAQLGLEQANREREDEAAQPVGRAQRLAPWRTPGGRPPARGPRPRTSEPSARRASMMTAGREAVPRLRDRPGCVPAIEGAGQLQIARVAGIGSDHQRDGHVGAARRHELGDRGLLSSRDDAPNWLIFLISHRRTRPRRRRAGRRRYRFRPDSRRPFRAGTGSRQSPNIQRRSRPGPTR